MAEMDEIYREYAKPVYLYLLGLCGSHGDAEEITAETFYQAVRSIHRFEGDSSLLTWLCQIAKHAWYKELRKRGRRGANLEPAEALTDPAPGPEQALAGKEARLELYRRMQRLETTAREVVTLRLTGELTFRQIGDILGRTETWARVTFYRAKERMRDDDDQQ